MGWRDGRRALACALATAICLAIAPGANAFRVTTHPTAFGQAPVFLPNGQVLFGKDFRQGQKNQVYIENWDGTGLHCLTCTGDPVSNDPNDVSGVPAVQPVPPGTPIGDIWVIFHSWRGHYVTLGSAGYGGLGSALWAFRLGDPSKQYELTETPNVNFSGEGYDDYHAYWSPNGTHIEWAHLNWNFVTGGGSGKWDVRVAEFHVDANGVPSLSNEHVVRPANGHWYETQWWNPNPATPGFLYTESYPEASGSHGGAAVPQLFYCRLVQQFSHCDVTRLSDSPSWDEQAIFTPDSKHVIFMSSRNADGLFNTWANLTRSAGIPSDYDYLLILPLFEAGFLQPVGQEATDLYELPRPFGDPGRVRRLTYDGRDGWITPEFTWDPSNRCLVWTENRFPDGYRYQFPEGVSGWLKQLRDLLSDPPNLAEFLDLGANGVGVASLPLEQRTRIGSFAGSGCALRP